MTLNVLIPAKTAEIVQTTQYTSPSGTRTIIDKFTATNDSGAPITLTVNLVNSGGAPGADNLILPAKTIPAGAVEEMYELVGHVLAQGDSISTIADVDSTLVIRASGRQFAG